MDAAKNFAKGTLDQGYDDAATSITLASGDGARFPAAPFNAVWWNATDFPDPADDPSVEIIRVTTKSTDTLTIQRAREGTGAVTHDDEGKVYRLIAGPTAKLQNENLLDVVNTAGDYLITGAAFTFNADDTFAVNASGTSLRLNAPAVGVVLDMSGGTAAIGDVDGNNTGVTVSADDNLGQCSLKGKIGTDQTASATTLGAVVKKLEVFDLAGNSLGFIPLYGSIT